MTPGPPGTSGVSTTLCAQFVVSLFVDAASVSVFDFAGRQSTVCASSGLAARVDSLQFELGEGPHWQALSSGQPVLCPDLRTMEHSSWPMFSTTAQGLGARAVFAFPMKLGAATVGVVDLLCTTPRRLDSHQVSLALSMANRSAGAAVRLATQLANESANTEHEMAPALRREVHQATGMIQVQLDTSATEALARLRSHAFAVGTSISTIAEAVVHGHLDFSSLPE